MIDNLDAHQAYALDSVHVYDLASGSPVPQLGGERMSVCLQWCWSDADDLLVNDQGYTALHTTTVCYPCDPSSDQATDEQLLAADSSGVHTVDTASSSSEKVPPSPSSLSITSVALNGDTLTWDHDGQPRSATLH